MNLPEEPRPLHLRASDADRNEVTQFLNDAYADGRLTPDEHGQRAESALQARTLGELAPLTADLTPLPPAVVAPAPAAPPARSYSIDRVQGGATQHVVAVFSGTTRRGPWRVKPVINAIAAFGGVDLDMRDATFEASEIVVNATAVFGGVDIYVPDGVEVVDETFALFGGTDIKNLAPLEPGAPRIVVRGMSLFGGVDVKGDAPRVSRAERRALRDQTRRQRRELR